MEFRNHTCFPALAYKGVTPDGVRFYTVALRQTVNFGQDRLPLDDEQAPLATKEVLAGKLNHSSILAESDLIPFKPNCDVIVNATAYAPGGRPSASFPVRLQVQEPGAGSIILDKTLLVSGPSWFKRRSLLGRCCSALVCLGTLFLVRRKLWWKTRPEKILALPVRYESAYGGEARILASDPAAKRVRARDRLPGRAAEDGEAAPAPAADLPIAWSVHEGNPIGKGFAPRWYLKATKARRVAAPQIEAPGARLTPALFLLAARGKVRMEICSALEPKGFGLLSKAWKPRSSLLGTVDDRFIRSSRDLPGDFEYAYWNGAPKDQQVPFLKGEEVITLTNLCPADTPGARQDGAGNTVLRLPLRGDKLFLLLRFDDGHWDCSDLVVDTVILDPATATLSLVWRGVLPVDQAIRVAEARMLDPGKGVPPSDQELVHAPGPAGSPRREACHG